MQTDLLNLILELIECNPNDMELGSKLRSLHKILLTTKKIIENE